MSPELPEAEIRRVVRRRMREGSLLATTSTVPAATVAKGNTACVVCGFVIRPRRNECEMDGARAHERCGVVWREESDRLL